MNRILIAFTGMLLPVLAMADFYTYPSRIDFDTACTLPAEELEAAHDFCSVPARISGSNGSAGI